MKICIPTAEDRGLASALHAHFGSAPYFAMLDVDAGNVEMVPNPACRHEHGSCHHVGLLAPRGVDAVVCTGIGKRALAGLREQGVDVLLTSAATVGDALAECRANAVRPLAADEACGGRHHGHHHHHHHHHAHGHGRARGGADPGRARDA